MMEDGRELIIENGRRRMEEDGGWMEEDGGWRMEEDGGWMEEVGGWMMKDGGGWMIFTRSMASSRPAFLSFFHALSSSRSFSVRPNSSTGPSSPSSGTSAFGTAHLRTDLHFVERSSSCVHFVRQIVVSPEKGPQSQNLSMSACVVDRQTKNTPWRQQTLNS